MTTEQNGSIHEDGIEVEFGGACPVQGYGTVDGRPVYYRSRGGSWQFEVYADGEIVEPLSSTSSCPTPTWEYVDNPYEFPDGGWVVAATSIACIKQAVARWREAGRP